MLQYIYNVDVGILKHCFAPNLEGKKCFLFRCYDRDNRDAFMYVFSYIVSNRLEYRTTWHKFIDYLEEAVELHPPHSEVAKDMLISIISVNWEIRCYNIIKRIIPLIDAVHSYIAETEYSHLAPQFAPLYTLNLVKACTHNNIDEVRHRLQYYDPNDDITFYEALVEPTNNKECFREVLPYLTNLLSGNTFLISAYVNNRLPNYRIAEYNNNITMRAVICHFTGSTNLKGADWNNSLLHIAHKFNFSIPLLYECVKISLNNKDDSKCSKRLDKNMQHKVDAISWIINNIPVSPCDCEFCKELRLYEKNME